MASARGGQEIGQSPTTTKKSTTAHLAGVGDDETMERADRHMHNLLSFQRLHQLRLANVRVRTVTQTEVVALTPATQSPNNNQCLSVPRGLRSSSTSALDVYATVHCRRPSVSRRRGTNMEQFASGSDLIKFPANLQSQTEISFMLGVVSIVSELL